MSARLLPTLALASVLATALVPSPVGARRAPATAITHVRVVDGTGAPAVEDQTVVVDGGRIASVGPATAATVPAGAAVVDGRGRTLLPGLIDTHVHFRDYVAELFVVNGVTTVRDAGNPTAWILALRDRQRAGAMRGPRIFATGNILDAPPVLRGHHTAVPTPAGARAAARELVAAGVDAIKVYEHVTPELLRPIVEEAHAGGRRVIGHITMSATDAALAGIDALEHASGIAVAIARDPAAVRAIPEQAGVFGWRFMDEAKADAAVKVFVDRKVAIVPALASWARGAALRAAFQAEAERVVADPELAYLPEDGKARVKNYASTDRPAAETRALVEDYAALKSFLGRLRRGGGTIVVGTDGGVLQGLSVHHELRLLVDMGLTPVEAIAAATGRAAALLQASDLGTIAPGKLADLLLVDGDPSRTIEDTRRIAGVWQGGVAIDARYHRDYRIPIPRPPVQGSRP